MISNSAFPARPATGTTPAIDSGRPPSCDAALHLSPYVEVKGEYINTWVETTDIGHHSPHGWWIQAGYKLAGLNLGPPVDQQPRVGRPLRYDMNDGLATRTQRGPLHGGLRLLLLQHPAVRGRLRMVAQQRSRRTGPSNQFLFQLSYGF